MVRPRCSSTRASSPRGSSFFAACQLDNRALTLVYWATAFLFSLGILGYAVPAAHRLPAARCDGRAPPPHDGSGGPERALYDVNLITYNGGFHLLIAALSLLVRRNRGQIARFSVYAPAFAYAMLALVRLAGRPPWYAFLALPLTFSFACGWGFANYVLSVPFVLIVFSWWVRSERGEKHLRWRIMLASFFSRTATCSRPSASAS